jgi:hypothetical protein
LNCDWIPYHGEFGGWKIGDEAVETLVHCVLLLRHSGTVSTFDPRLSLRGLHREAHGLRSDSFEHPGDRDRAEP